MGVVIRRFRQIGVGDGEGDQNSDLIKNVSASVYILSDLQTVYSQFVNQGKKFFILAA